MKQFFGNINETFKLVSREELDNGLIKTVFKFGKLNVTGISNKPSDDAINRLADEINNIAAKYVFELKMQKNGIWYFYNFHNMDIIIMYIT